MIPLLGEPGRIGGQSTVQVGGLLLLVDVEGLQDSYLPVIPLPSFVSGLAYFTLAQHCLTVPRKLNMVLTLTGRHFSILLPLFRGLLWHLSWHSLVDPGQVSGVELSLVLLVCTIKVVLYHRTVCYPF